MARERPRSSPASPTDARRRETPPPAVSVGRGLWIAAVLLTSWSFGYAVLRGSDLWWHLAAGRLIWNVRRLPAVDPWSFTRAGRPWLHHEWLSDVIYHAWVRVLGVPSLVAWKWGVLAVTFSLLFLLLERLTRHPAASYLAVLLAMAVGAPFFDIRPHLYSLLGYVLVLALTLLPRRPSLALVPLFLVWANLHGGFFFGLMALFLVLALSVLVPGEGADRLSLRRAAGLGLACIIASLANPNGVGAFTYPLRYAFIASSLFRRELGEWLPPSIPGGIRSPLFPAAAGIFLAAVAVLTAAGEWRRDRRRYFTALALSALTLAMSLRSRRFIPLFALSESLVVAPALAWLLPVLGRGLGLVPRKATVRRTAALFLPLLAVAFAAVRLALYPLSSSAFHALTEEASFPVETCDFMVANDLSGNVFAAYAWGGYLELRAAGRLRVYIDGRADTVYDDETYRRYLRVPRLEPGWQQVLDGSHADYLLWPVREPLIDRLLATGGWRKVHEDFASVLLVRDGVPLPMELRSAPDSGHRELALGAEAMTAGQLDSAAAHFERALALAPYLVPACTNLALVQATQRKATEAARTGERCQRIFPNPEQRLLLDRTLARGAAVSGPGRLPRRERAAGS
jgi:hypothetical protein